MDPDTSLIDVFVQPGELFVADAGYRLRTLLGSCVSFTLWHPATRTGGMSHFLLPSRAGSFEHGLWADAAGPAPTLDGRYGDEALRLILSEFARAGIAPQQCQAKVFGGGNMFPAHIRPGSANVGQRNGEAARALLQAHAIPIVSESLFGIGHRQIVFDVSNGDVWQHQVSPAAQDIQAGEAGR